MERFILFVLNVLLTVMLNKISTLNLIGEAVYITSKYFKPQLVTSVVYNKFDVEDVSEFLTKYPGSVVITCFGDKNASEIFIDIKENAAYAQTVLFTANVNNFENFITKVNQESRFAIRLILVYKDIISTLIKLSEFYKIAWRNNLADLIIISRHLREEITISTYFPYQNGICGNFDPVILQQHENIFPKKFLNLNKCPVRITAISFQSYVDKYTNNSVVTGVGGFDGLTLTKIIEEINGTIQFVEVAEKNGIGGYFDGKATGSMYELINNKTDIVLPAGIVSSGRYSVTQISHAYHHLDVRWIGPKRKEMYHWTKILAPFLSIVTLLLCFTFFIFVLVSMFITRQKLYKKYKNNNVYFHTFTLLVGQTLHFVTSVPLLSNLFLLWIWFCFIVRIVYQIALIEFLQKTIFEPPYKSLEDAVKRVDGYGGLEIIFPFYKNTSFENDYKVLPLTDYFTKVKHIAEGEKFLMTADTFQVRHVRSSIEISSLQITSSWASFFMRPGWPIAPTIDLVLIRLIETGFSVKLLREDNKEQIFETKKLKDNSLDMEMVSSCFYVLVLMWVVCLFVFIIELMYHKRMFMRSEPNS